MMAVVRLEMLHRAKAAGGVELRLAGLIPRGQSGVEIRGRPGQAIEVDEPDDVREKFIGLAARQRVQPAAAERRENMGTAALLPALDEPLGEGEVTWITRQDRKSTRLNSSH